MPPRCGRNPSATGIPRPCTSGGHAGPWRRRVVIFAQMVDDPSAHPDRFPTEEAQDRERQRLFRLIEELVKWENTTNEKVLQQARNEIWRS